MANLTPKQEAFCLKYIETGNASEAYRLAYDADDMKPETVHRNAKALLDNSKIATRVEQLQAEHRQRHDVTVDSITAELEAARLLAIKHGNPSAAVSAIMGNAKIHGLLTDRQELSGPGGRPLELSDAKDRLLRDLVPTDEQILDRYVQKRMEEEKAKSAH